MTAETDGEIVTFDQPSKKKFIEYAELLWAKALGPHEV